MSPQVRALIIGMFGPVLQAFGVAWDLLEHAVFARGEAEHITLVHILSGPAHLIIFTGFALSVVCIPIAIEVARARPEDLEAPPYEPEIEQPKPTYGLEGLEGLEGLG